MPEHAGRVAGFVTGRAGWPTGRIATQGCLAVLGLLVTACTPAPPAWHGTDLTGAPYGQAWHLVDQDGHARTQADYRGQVALVYFGFTHCPDVCPTTLNHLKQALARLTPAQQGAVRVLFVTVDEADTPPVLKAWLAGYGPAFQGLTGNQAALETAAKDFRVYAQRQASGAGFEHAGFVYALDPAGHPRVLYAPDADPAGIAADVTGLLAGASR